MSHYFHTPEPGSDARRRTVRATVWGRDYEFVTAAGVFSAGGLDLGTAVLLRTCLPAATTGRILDLGCGWGPLAVPLAVECPRASVDAVDTNELALALCAENAARAGVRDRVPTLLPHEADPEARYAEIWSNPPIRIGKEALHTLLLTWLPRLATGGVARLVVNKNLGADSLQRWLIAQGYAAERVGSAKGFRVLVVPGP